MIDEKKLIEELDRKLYGMQIISKRIVLDIINEQPKVGEWIPCSEKLPEIENKDYLVSIGKRTVITLTWTKEGWNTFKRNDGSYVTEYRNDKVIAWMPLPKPYKEGE